MDCEQTFICVALLVNIIFTQDLREDLVVHRNITISNETMSAYNTGVLLGIISPQVYTIESFEQDQPTFQKLYNEFVLWSDTVPMNYQEWLIMNNYGLLADTKESILNKKSSKRNAYAKKKKFMRTVLRGDILISSRSDSGVVGHAALMVTKNWVLEMAGGRRWKNGLANNNRQVTKEQWYDENCDETATIYRNPDKKKAFEAAYWADRNYFNPTGGQKKEIRVTYKLTSNFKSKDPSYSSKLVLQAYYYGTNGVIEETVINEGVIAPTSIPKYFMPDYKLTIIDKFQM